MSKEIKILFLYTELAGYLMSCIQELVDRKVDVHVLRYPVNSEAPFKFNIPKGVQLHERAHHQGTLIKFVDDLKPDAILCSGWIDKEYLAVCKSWRGRIPTILLLDNQWSGSLKQRIASLAAISAIKPKFSHAWVPGKPQFIYAEKLGFKKDKIRTGFYCADLNSFNAAYLNGFEEKRKKFPHKLIYIGRYLPFKGVDMLWNVFSELRKEGFEDWELHCLGTGDMWDSRIINDGIIHHGFVQPEEMPKYLQDSGIFILPSLKEPWGVVVQEMAAAGFPMVLSNNVGAASTFLAENENGFSFESGNADSLKEALKKIMVLTDDQLIQMGQSSHQIAQTINPELWADTLLELL